MDNVQTPQKEPGDIYLEAAVLAQSTDPAELSEAYKLFASIPGYEDADKRAAELKPAHDKYEQEKKSNELWAKQAADRKKKRTKKLIIFAVILALLATAVLLVFLKINSDYNRALELIEQGEYREADDILESLLGYGDSKKLQEDLQVTLDAFDAIRAELLSGEEISIHRMDELHAALLLIRDFSEAEELLSRFSRQLHSYTRTPATGSYTMFNCGYDYAGNLEKVTASSHTASGEVKVEYTQYITGTEQDSQVTHEYRYSSNKLSDDTVLKEVWFYDNGHVIEYETTYDNDPTRHIFYRWYDADGKLLYGTIEDSDIPKTTSSKTVLVECRQLDADGRLTRSWQLEVSKKGNISTDKEFETVYTYDEQGNLTQEVHYKTTEKKGKVDYNVSYTYDEKNRLIEMIDDGNSTTYTYNDHDELAKSVLTNKYGQTTEITYNHGYIFNRSGLFA